MRAAPRTMSCWRLSARIYSAQTAAVASPNLSGLRLGDERGCNHLRRADHGVCEANAAVRLWLFSIRDHGRKDSCRYCDGESGGDEAEGERRFHVSGLSAGD